MNTLFEKTHFLAKPYFLSMIVGEERLLPQTKCPYTTLKAMAWLMKKQGTGEWQITKKRKNGVAEGYTKITRLA